MGPPTLSKQQISRKHHYVPEWYQRGFISSSDNTLYYLNLSPDTISLPDGSTKTHNALRRRSPAQCFHSYDLYSVFMFPTVIDVLERHLFGSIDNKGARAVTAILTPDPNQWHRHFNDLFLFLDAQKLRTLKGLNWLRAQYSALEQNDLMLEMQQVRTYNCGLWSECVREIVTARQSSIKFIISDHPITVYNYACPPDHPLCVYPNDPSIALKASQTIFALDQNHCLILTNLEYADSPDRNDPLQPRTFARRFRQSLIRTDNFIRSRNLNDYEVTAINHIIKSRAKDYLAAGSEKFLYPEKQYRETWREARKILLPPDDELWRFRGETFVGFKDGTVLFQDAYGRNTPASDIFAKHIEESLLRPKDACGCGSGKMYKSCCRNKPKEKRPSWNQQSIRERNLTFRNALYDILEISGEIDWVSIRKTMNDEKVKKIHEIYGTLWPPETDIFDLLPKPDGEVRAVYSGLIDPIESPLVVANANLYFGEIMVQSPFINYHQVNEEYSPISYPRQYLVQTLSNVLLFFQLLPWIEYGSVNFIPDPCSFDPYLQRYVGMLAQERHGQGQGAIPERASIERLTRKEIRMALLSMPEEYQRRMIAQTTPMASEDTIRGILQGLAHGREEHPLIPLNEEVIGSHGNRTHHQLRMLQMAPNFEMLLFIAQATGAFVVTDNKERWGEIRAANDQVVEKSGSDLFSAGGVGGPLQNQWVMNLEEAYSMLRQRRLEAYRRFVAGFLSKLDKPNGNWDIRRIKESERRARKAIRRERKIGLGKGMPGVEFCFWAPRGGIGHNHVQRLMVKCGVEGRPQSVPLAVFMDTAEIYGTECIDSSII